MMTEAKDNKVGDVVAWADVPDGAMVRWIGPHRHEYDMRIAGVGHVMAVSSSGAEGMWESWEVMGSTETAWPWSEEDCGQNVTIIALNVPADATAEHLRELAERFEVREALTARPRPMTPLRFARVYVGDDMLGGFSGSCDRALDVWAGRLYRAGWRKGMTAEDAARLLSGAPGT